jgi:hypothetical protein
VQATLTVRLGTKSGRNIDNVSTLATKKKSPNRNIVRRILLRARSKSFGV